MGLLNVIDAVKNEVKAAVGYQQSFASLLSSKDIARALSMMQDRSSSAQKALLEYKIEHHEVMKRQDKAVLDKRVISSDGKNVGKYQFLISRLSMKLRWYSCMADL